MRFMTSAALVCALTVTAGSMTAAQGQTVAGAQTTWTGGYVGGSIGAGIPRVDFDAKETVLFDTNLDGTFSDTVRTAAGADAFSPGFCGGIAVGSLPSAGCMQEEDEDGNDFGGRAGYDWQMGGFVIGALVDISATNDIIDGVSAFSTTPAFYAFSRELTYVGGLRGRVGGGSNRVLVYGTGGAAWGGVDHQFTSSNGVNTFVPAKDEIRSEMAWGYQAGGGVEVRLGSHWSVTGEYLFTSLDDKEDGTVRSQGPAPATNPFILVNPAGTDLRREDRFEFETLRVGLSYRF